MRTIDRFIVNRSRVCIRISFLTCAAGPHRHALGDLAPRAGRMRCRHDVRPRPAPLAIADPVTVYQPPEAPPPPLRPPPNPPKPPPPPPPPNPPPPKPPKPPPNPPPPNGPIPLFQPLHGPPPHIRRRRRLRLLATRMMIQRMMIHQGNPEPVVRRGAGGGGTSCRVTPRPCAMRLTIAVVPASNPAP